MENRYIFVHILFPLIISSSVYIFLGTGNQHFFFWLHIHSLHLSCRVPSFIKNNLPDGLWLYAFIKTLEMIWKKHSEIAMYGWFGIATLLAVLSEFLQKWKIIPGTFDMDDMLIYQIVFVICLLQNAFNHILTPKTNLQ